jgi:hypothetical protein
MVAAAIAATAGCGVYERSAQPGTPVEFSGSLAQNQGLSLEVAPDVGVDLRVTGASGSGVKMDAMPANDLSDLKIATASDPQWLRLRLSATTVGRSHWGWLFGHHAEASVTMTVPSDAMLSLRAVNGPVRVDGVRGPLGVHVVNGVISVRGAGSVLSLHLVNGAIEASITDLSRTPNVDVSGTNGSIEVLVPKGFAARIDAHTLIGPLEQDINDTQAPGLVTIHLVTGPVTIQEH